MAEIPLDGINIDEQKTVTSDLTIKPELFERYGYIDCFIVGTDKEGNYITEGESKRILVSRPLEVMLNGEIFPESIEIAEGDTMEFNISCKPSALNDDLSASFGSDDPGIVTFDGTTLKAVSAGTTTVRGVITPYGTTTKDITVTVTEKSPVTINLPVITETSFDYEITDNEMVLNYDMYVALYKADNTLLGIKKNIQKGTFGVSVDEDWTLKVMLWKKDTMEPAAIVTTYTAADMLNQQQSNRN